MGLRADIFKSDYRSDQNIISSKYDKVTIVNAEGPFDPLPDAPAVLMVRGPGNEGANNNGHIVAVPAIFDKAKNEWVRLKPRAHGAFGGTFISASDSRYHELLERLGGQRGTAIGLHDHYE